MIAAISAGAVALGVGVVGVVLAAPGPARLPRERRRPLAEEGEGALAGATEAATTIVARLMRRRSGDLTKSLELAGVKMRPQDFGFLVAVAIVVVVALLLVVGAGPLALLGAAAPPIVAILTIRLRVQRRRNAFGVQLDGTLQLIASSLRAGYSLMQALGSVAKQSEEPTASELARVVNESRVGRPVVSALEESALRMANQDFGWAIQAIAINREVGGSLAETLDGVAGTIRERSQIKRQVKTLSAEGRLSAVILMALPFLVGVILLLVSPSYLEPFMTPGIGTVLLIVGAVMLTVGGLWMHKVTKIVF